jgi:plasmid maintenance system killer protein
MEVIILLSSPLAPVNTQLSGFLAKRKEFLASETESLPLVEVIRVNYQYCIRLRWSNQGRAIR